MGAIPPLSFCLLLNIIMSNLSIPSDTFNLFPADPTSHVMQFQRMPMTTFTIQEVNLPAISARTGVAPMPGGNAHFLPDKLIYEPLSITFMVDEELRAWRELFSWLLGMTGAYDRGILTAEFLTQQTNYVQAEKPTSRLERAGRTTAGLTIVNGAKIPILRFLFYNVYVSSLGQIQFDTKTTDTITPITCTATFEYDYYTLVELRR